MRVNYDKIYLARVTESPLSYEEYYSESIYGEFGIHTHFVNHFNNINEKDIIKREIELLKYYNLNSYVIDNSYNFVPVTYSVYEGLKFRELKGKKHLMKSTKDMTDKEIEELFAFYQDNIVELLEYTDSEVKYIVEMVSPIYDERINKQTVDNINSRYENFSREVLSKGNIFSNKTNRVLEFAKEFEKYNSDDNIKYEGREASHSPSRASILSYTLNYARRHGYSNYYQGGEPPSPYYDYSYEGGDCANFVSQCLHEGNVGFWTNGESADNSWYFYNYYNRSISWINAQKFRLHWQQRVPADYHYVQNSLSFLESGTPISLLDKYDNYRAFHTVITTDKHSNGYNFSYAAHSDNGRRTNLLSKLQGNPDIKYYNITWR